MPLDLNIERVSARALCLVMVLPPCSENGHYPPGATFGAHLCVLCVMQGLVGFVNLMRSHPRAVAEHRALVLACLSDDDVTIRTRALELLSGVCWLLLVMVIVMPLSV